MSELEVKKWEEIYPGEKSNNKGWTVIPPYTDFGGIRAYNEKVYLKVKDGWVLLDDVVELFEKTLEEKL